MKGTVGNDCLRVESSLDGLRRVVGAPPQRVERDGLTVAERFGQVDELLESRRSRLQTVDDDAMLSRASQQFVDVTGRAVEQIPEEA